MPASTNLQGTTSNHDVNASSVHCERNQVTSNAIPASMGLGGQQSGRTSERPAPAHLQDKDETPNLSVNKPQSRATARNEVLEEIINLPSVNPEGRRGMPAILERTVRQPLVDLSQNHQGTIGTESYFVSPCIVAEDGRTQLQNSQEQNSNVPDAHSCVNNDSEKMVDDDFTGHNAKTSSENNGNGPRNITTDGEVGLPEYANTSHEPVPDLNQAQYCNTEQIYTAHEDLDNAFEELAVEGNINCQDQDLVLPDISPSDFNNMFCTEE